MSVDPGDPGDPGDPVIAPHGLPSAWPVPDWRPPIAATAPLGHVIQALHTTDDQWSSPPSDVEVTAQTSWPDAVGVPDQIGFATGVAPVAPASVPPSPPSGPPAVAPTARALLGQGATFGDPAVGSVPAQFRPDRLVKPKAAVPGRGARRLLFRITAGRLNLGKSAAEQARLRLISRVRTPAATGRRRVAFVSLKGGVGKTTTTVMLGHTLASYRGDNVVAIDANPDAGNLASRVPRQTPAASRDLLRAAGTLERYADVRAFTSQAGSRLQVLAGESDPALSEAFSAEDYSAVLAALERFYSIVLTDCGTGILHDAMRAVLWYADQLVIITSPALDSAQALNQLLEWLDRHGYHHLVQPAVVVVNALRRDSEVGAREFVSYFGSRCRAVVSVPYDRALSTGGVVDLTDLDAKTQRAYLDLAAAVADGFTTPRLQGH